MKKLSDKKLSNINIDLTEETKTKKQTNLDLKKKKEEKKVPIINKNPKIEAVKDDIKPKQAPVIKEKKKEEKQMKIEPVMTDNHPIENKPVFNKNLWLLGTVILSICAGICFVNSLIYLREGINLSAAGYNFGWANFVKLINSWDLYGQFELGVYYIMGIMLLAFLQFCLVKPNSKPKLLFKLILSVILIFAREIMLYAHNQFNVQFAMPNIKIVNMPNVPIPVIFAILTIAVLLFKFGNNFFERKGE